MKRSLQSLRRLTAATSSSALHRPAAFLTPALAPSHTAVRCFASSRHNSLATVADLTLAKGLNIDTPETLVVTPGEDMLGFEVNELSEDRASMGQQVGRPIYLDMQATTPTDPRVLDAMMPFMTNQYGNPHSKTHAYGWETEKAVEDGRKVSPSVLACAGHELTDGTLAVRVGSHWREPQGHHLHQWSNRVQQHECQGHCSILQGQEEAHVRSPLYAPP
jgi:hypothetical protein